MKNFIFGLIIGVTILTACAMGGKSARLKAPMDRGKTPWEFCTPKMVADYKGKYCLIECEIKLLKNGTCKKGKYKYIVKDAVKEHDFFMNKFIIVPEGYFY